MGIGDPTLDERIRVAGWLLRLALRTEELSQQEALVRAATTVLDPGGET